MVLCECGCNTELPLPIRKDRPPKYIRGHQNKGRCSGMKGKHHTKKAKEKNRLAHLGKCSSPKTVFKKGLIPWNKGLHPKCLCDENHYNWKGGKRLRQMRMDAKRRRLGINPLNEPFKNSEGHHINQNDIIYIPKEWHHIVAHDVWKGKNMDVVNSYAFFFLLMQSYYSYFSEMKG